MVRFESINPFNQEILARFEEDAPELLESKLERAGELTAPNVYPFQERLNTLPNLSDLLRQKRDKMARNISLEMGKPIVEARAEIEKCAWLCDYYYEQAECFLRDVELDLNPDIAIRRYEPLGVVLGIMPWNFPYWQVFRFAIPAILAGNSVLLKHAPNCQICAEDIEDLFASAGFRQGLYRNIRLNNERIADLIADPRIKGLSLTGSEIAGKAVASEAGNALKPVVLELGGSNAFILHESADVQKAAKLARAARLMNAGQSCIAAKRFLVPRAMVDEFSSALEKEFRSIILGNPLDENTQLGPLARMDLKEKALSQLEESIRQGAISQYGPSEASEASQANEAGKAGEGLFIQPTILREVNPEMPVFQEEVFAPIASICAYDHWEEAIAISNASKYGLGVSLIGEDWEFLLNQASLFEEGAVFINELVKSDPRLPFGGVKQSGCGRELGPEGIRSFTNLKTIYRKV